MKSLKEVRNQLLIIHDDGVINDKGTMMLTLRTILILVLTLMIWKTTRAFQSFTPTRTTYHFWLKIPEIVECHQRSIRSGLEALCIFLKSHSYPCRYSDMIARFGKLISVLCVINNYMIDYIYQAHSYRILRGMIASYKVNWTKIFPVDVCRLARQNSSNLCWQIKKLKRLHKL